MVAVALVDANDRRMLECPPDRVLVFEQRDLGLVVDVRRLQQLNRQSRALGIVQDFNDLASLGRPDDIQPPVWTDVFTTARCHGSCKFLEKSVYVVGKKIPPPPLPWSATLQFNTQRVGSQMPDGGPEPDVT